MEHRVPAYLGSRIKQFARIRGLSLAQLSTRAGIPYLRLQRLLNGHRQPKANELETIVAALSLKVPNQESELVLERATRAIK